MIHYFQRLQEQISSNWNKTALADFGGDSFSFGETAERIASFHLLFQQMGLKKGDKIAICARNQARWGICFLAANTYGAVVVPILADFTPDSICRLLNHSQSEFLFTDAEIWKRLDTGSITSVKRAMAVSDSAMLFGSDQDKETVDGLARKFTETYPAGFSATDVHYPTDNGKDLALINYTSGSTGEPKGVMVRYECISANVQFGQKRMPSFPQDNILSILPMAHMFGMAFELIYPLCGGTAVHFLGKAPSPTRLMNAMKEVKPYLVVAVPMVFEKIYRNKLKPVLDKPAAKFMLGLPLVRNILFSRMRKSIDTAFGGKVRTYIMGGAGVNPEVEEFLHRIGFRFTVGYGMTEAAPLIAYEDWNRFVIRSCGKAMDSVEVRIDSRKPDSVPGEIQIKGTNVFSGYYLNEKATKDAFTEDGWFNTGDLGLIDKKGNIFIKGRIKSMLLSSNGQNIYPEEVESVIDSQPHVLESLVVPRNGKLVGLVYMDEDTDEETVGNIFREINSRLPGYSKLARIEIVKEPFEKTPKQSIKRFLYK